MKTGIETKKKRHCSENMHTEEKYAAVIVVENVKFKVKRKKHKKDTLSATVGKRTCLLTCRKEAKAKVSNKDDWKSDQKQTKRHKLKK